MFYIWPNIFLSVFWYLWKGEHDLNPWKSILSWGLNPCIISFQYTFHCDWGWCYLWHQRIQECLKWCLPRVQDKGLLQFLFHPNIHSFMVQTTNYYFQGALQIPSHPSGCVFTYQYTYKLIFFFFFFQACWLILRWKTHLLFGLIMRRLMELIWHQMDLKHGHQKLVCKRVWTSLVPGDVIAQVGLNRLQMREMVEYSWLAWQSEPFLYIISNHTSLLLTSYINGINLDDAFRCKQK